MSLFALGPLTRTHEDLWCLTWGEIEDLIAAWRYSQYLESRKQARLAAWIINGTTKRKHPVRVEDLVGYWVDGEIMSKNDYFEYSKEKIKQKKGR